VLNPVPIAPTFNDKTDPPDIKIEIPRNLCGTLEFSRAQEMIDFGYKKCKKVLG
jgi:predicted acylesterase/phospholipase RssA